MTILYVDDDLDDQEIFRDALSKISPHSILYVANEGREAMTMLDSIENRLDYIFFDINMPVMNGKEFVQEYFSRNSSNRVPIVIYSTSCNPKEADEFKRLGAAQFVSKNSSFSEVCRALKEFI